MKEEGVLSREMRMVVEDEIMNAREARISKREKDLATRLSDLEDSERIHLATINELQDRITQDKERLEQEMENTACWTRSELEHILWERMQGIISRDK